MGASKGMGASKVKKKKVSYVVQKNTCGAWGGVRTIIQLANRGLTASTCGRAL